VIHPRPSPKKWSRDTSVTMVRTTGILLGLLVVACDSPTADELCAPFGLVPDSARGACRCPDGTMTREDGSGCDLPDGGFIPLPEPPSDAATREEDAGSCVVRRFYRDADEDGHGASEDVVEACAPPVGYVGLDDDCNDSCPTCHPGATEVCDGADNDCDRVVDGTAASLECGVVSDSEESVCSGGVCQVAVCREGRRDCDGEFSNGCETTLGTVSACTSCGEVCGWSCDESGCNDASIVDGGSLFTCARREDGTLACWGNGELAQLGDGAFASRNRPVVLEGSFEHFALGLWHGCGVGEGGTVRCWGLNATGEVGNGTTDRVGAPTVVNMLGGFAHTVAAGGGHSCAALTDGSLRCWGNNSWGQLGVSASGARTTPVRAIGAGTAGVAAGYGFTCALMTNNTVRCWGENTNGQLGNNSRETTHTPTQVLGLTSVRQVDAAPQGVFVCALQDGGTVWCWGRNHVGQLGDGTMMTRQIPVRVQGVSDARAIAVGETHACALREAGTVVCWGGGELGQLGNGAMATSPEPVEVSGLEGVSSLGCGGHHCCGVVSGGLWCWGRNESGELGDTSDENRPTPVRVASPG
jgi:alpha-tubulin suppressor-like RCC1 family protein